MFEQIKLEFERKKFWSDSHLSDSKFNQNAITIFNNEGMLFSDGSGSAAHCSISVARTLMSMFAFLLIGLALPLGDLKLAVLDAPIKNKLNL